jgi:hypothetical protein
MPPKQKLANARVIRELPVEYTFLSSGKILAGKKITPSIATHAWRAIFEVLLNFGKDAKSTHLETSGYKKDIFQISFVDMVLRLIRNRSSFCLMGDGVHNYELFIDEATLYMRQEKLVLRLCYNMRSIRLIFTTILS